MPPEWELPKNYGTSLETTAFDYDNSSSVPTIQLDGKSGRNGYVAFAANEVEYLGSFHLCYPEVMALWKQVVDELIGADVDGIDIPSRQPFRLLERLLQVCRTVTVTLRMDPDGNDTALFAPDIRTYHKLQQVAQTAGSAFYTEVP